MTCHNEGCLRAQPPRNQGAYSLSQGRIGNGKRIRIADDAQTNVSSSWHVVNISHKLSIIPCSIIISSTSISLSNKTSYIWNVKCKAHTKRKNYHTFVVKMIKIGNNRKSFLRIHVDLWNCISYLKRLVIWKEKGMKNIHCTYEHIQTNGSVLLSGFSIA